MVQTLMLKMHISLGLIFLLFLSCTGSIVFAETQHAVSLSWLGYEEKVVTQNRTVMFEPDEYTILYSATFDNDIGLAFNYRNGSDRASLNSNNVLVKDDDGFSASVIYYWADSWLEFGFNNNQSDLELDKPQPGFDFDEKSDSIEMFVGYGKDFEWGEWLISPYTQFVFQESDTSLFRRNVLDTITPVILLDRTEKGIYATSTLNLSYPAVVSDDGLFVTSVDLSWTEGLAGDGISRTHVYSRERSSTSQDEFSSELEGSGAISFSLAVYYEKYGADASVIEPIDSPDSDTQLTAGVSFFF